MIVTKHESENGGNHDSVIDFFFEKSKEYELQNQTKKQKEDELRITMFAKHEKDHKKKGDYLGFLGSSPNWGAVKEENKEEQKKAGADKKPQAASKDEQVVNAVDKRPENFVQNAWKVLNALDPTQELSPEEIKKEEMKFLEDFYSFHFRAKNLSSMAEKITSLNQKRQAINDEGNKVL